MVAVNYKAFVDRMIHSYEGGYCWNAGDSGGPTKYGITCWDLAKYENKPMNSMHDWAPRVQAMSLDVAETIYRTKYAAACRFDDLASGCDCCVFDFGVNSGPSKSIRSAQAIVGASLDGILGPVTLELINAMSASEFIDALCDSRMRFLKQLSIWHTFGVGWTRRVADLRRYCHALVKPPLIATANAYDTEIPLVA